MMSDAQRLNSVNSLLTRLGSLNLYRLPYASDQIFEIYCYFRKIEQFINRSKIAEGKMINYGLFAPHSKPGRPRTASYFSIRDPLGGQAHDLILNGRFTGTSGINHSPDITLTPENDDKIISIFECKNYSARLGLGVFREFIGYYEEMGLLRTANRDRIEDVISIYPEMKSCIYTSAVAASTHKENMMRRYGFATIDRF
jgi:hypothetical protein